MPHEPLTRTVMLEWLIHMCKMGQKHYAWARAKELSANTLLPQFAGIELELKQRMERKE